MNQFIYPLKVYIEDTDYGGVVYHSNYLKYFERARTEWAEQLGLGIAWQNDQKIYFPVRSANLDYLRPARLGDVLEVVSSIAQLKPASLLYSQYLRLVHTPDTILCKAEIKIACVDHTFKPCVIPRCLLHDIITGASV